MRIEANQAQLVGEVPPLHQITTDLKPLTRDNEVLVTGEEIELWVQTTLEKFESTGITADNLASFVSGVVSGVESAVTRDLTIGSTPSLTTDELEQLALVTVNECMDREGGFVGTDADREALKQRAAAQITIQKGVIAQKWDLDTNSDSVAKWDQKHTKVRQGVFKFVHLNVTDVVSEETGAVLVTAAEIRRLVEWVADSYEEEGITERTIARAVLTTVRGTEKISETVKALHGKPLTGPQKRQIATQVLFELIDTLYPGSEEGKELLKLLVPTTIDTIVASLNTHWGESEKPAICKILCCLD